ncbi:MAG TPA: hypothetical protein PKA05_17065 [Roseiflexaceae bacterium]|nr:hypothetical protein [Roseiflexaceae bacterium]
MTQNEPTIATILQQLAREYQGLVAEREVFDRVLERRPSQAKNPYTSIRERLRFSSDETGWVRAGRGTLMPLHILLDRLRIRLTPDATEITGGYVLAIRLRPFLPALTNQVQLNLSGTPPIRQTLVEVDQQTQFFARTSLALPLQRWYRDTGFKPGDHILVTFSVTEPLTLALEHEPAEALRRDDIVQREQELINRIAEIVTKSRHNPLHCHECVLPVYAQIAWRHEYPTRSWQQLVEQDPRLRLLDGDSVAPASFTRPLDMIIPATTDTATTAFEEQLQLLDASLLNQITELQHAMLASRREAAEQQLWDGMAPRASTAHVIFDTENGSSTLAYREPINALESYIEAIDVQRANGEFDLEAWEEADESYDEEADEFGEDPFGVSEIDDLQEFLDQNPALADAAQKLMAALTSDEIERLQRAETQEDAQQILAHRFHKILPADPSMFATLVPYTPEEAPGTNGGAHAHPGMSFFDDGFGEFFSDDIDEEEIEWTLLLDGPQSRAAMGASTEQIESFRTYLAGQGKSKLTVATRSNDLWIYAEFLASYYNRSLAEGDYATLDECLFFFYPRRVANSSPRAARELCTSLKQFYAFLKEQIGRDDAFAQAIWKRRDQAGRMVELHELISEDSPLFGYLQAQLFAPYTA